MLRQCRCIGDMLSRHVVKKKTGMMLTVVRQQLQ